MHLNQSISTPFSVVEFQGGSFDPWGGPGFGKCTDLLGPEFQRVFYKNVYSFGATIFNIYMIYGGTNWGNLGHPGGYTSYDYGAAITEERTVEREKYSQAKLLAHFLQASPAYLEAFAQDNTYANGSLTGNSAIATTTLLTNSTKFFVVRHAAYNSLDTTEYSITLPTSKGNITIPQLGGKLSLHGRDSKVYVTDYDVGGSNLLYSTAEIFTWKKYGSQRVLLVYTGPDEINELAFTSCGDATVVEGSDINMDNTNGVIVMQFATSTEKRIVSLCDGLSLHIVDRNSAYDYWVVEKAATPSISAPIVKAGYLIRSYTIEQSALHLIGDLNATTTIEVIGGAPDSMTELTFNGKQLPFTVSKSGIITATAEYAAPEYTIPKLSELEWKVIDSLPEIQADYEDSLWTSADLTYSNNTARNLTTPTSLYAGDYGFHTGSLLYRAHFTANGNESTIFLFTQGGSAFGHSVWLNDMFVGSFVGADLYKNTNATYSLPPTPAGTKCILTILLDNQGLDESGSAGESPTVNQKKPRGILDYDLPGHDPSDLTWKLTGNLGGEDYQDRARGPLNEGGLFAERQGYHLPGTPISTWEKSSTSEGLSAPGVAFYATTFNLDLPVGYDIPLSFSFANTTTDTSTTLATAYRAQLFVNGYQFGKYIHNIGPQDVFPVPEGIFNYQGENYVALSLWALEAGGAKLEGFELVDGHPVQSGFGAVGQSPQPGWVKREGAY